MQLRRRSPGWQTGDEVFNQWCCRGPPRRRLRLPGAIDGRFRIENPPGGRTEGATGPWRGSRLDTGALRALRAEASVNLPTPCNPTRVGAVKPRINRHQKPLAGARE